MGALPVYSRTLGASKEFLLLIEDEFRYLSLCLLSWDLIQESITHKASGKKGFLDQRDDFSLDQFSQLERRLVLGDSDNSVLWSFRAQLGASGQDHPAFLPGQFYQRIDIFTPVINGIIAQHPQFPSQLSKHSVRDKLHYLKLMVHAWQRTLIMSRSQPGSGCPSLDVFPDDRFQILFRFFGDILLAGDHGVF